MKLKILTLNCQKAYNPNLKDFIYNVLKEEKYDFILLQEANKTVLNIIREYNTEYLILNPFDSNLAENAHECILYKKFFSLTESSFISFSPNYGWGFLVGVFEYNNSNFVISSVHLRSGLKKNIRLEELEIVKNKLSKYIERNINKNYSIIFGGDFNTGLYKEVHNLNKILLPEFIRISKSVGATLNSKYTEKAPYLLNNISILFAKFGLGLTFRTDHIYVDSLTSKKYKIICNKLSNRVSDHLPIEAEFLLYS